MRVLKYLWPRKPKYTEDGERLYNLLLDKDGWDAYSEYIVHKKSDLVVKLFNKFNIEVGVRHAWNSEIKFSQSDIKRILPMVEEIRKYIKNKPVRAKLQQFGSQSPESSSLSSSD